jgi:hypothetical protein
MSKKESHNEDAHYADDGQTVSTEAGAVCAVPGNGDPPGPPKAKARAGSGGNGAGNGLPNKAVGGTEGVSNDPFDPERLRLSQDFAADLGVKKAMLTVPVDKPKPEWWVRVRPDEMYRLQTLILNMKEDREKFLIAPELRQELITEPMVSAQAIFTAINRQGVVFLWPVRLPGPDGKIDQWSKSAMEAATMAMQGWVRMASNMALGAYDCWQTTAPLPEPQWPDMPFKELLKIGFKDRYIDSLEHPVLKRLRGES